MKLKWTQESLLKLQEIEEFISLDNPNKAIKFIDELILVAEKLTANPEMGRIVPELSINKLREIIHKNYRIIYKKKKKDISILTVFEGHRKLRTNELDVKKKN